MIDRFVRKGALVGFCALSSLLPCEAVFLVGNENVASPGLGSGYAIGAEFNNGVAASFVTGSVAHRLDRIQVQLGGVTATIPPASGPDADLVVSFYQDDGSGEAFGASMGRMDGVARPLTPGDYSYSFSPTIVLAPSTKYWVSMTANTSLANGSWYHWSATTDPTVDPVPAPGWDKPFDKIQEGFYQAGDNTSVFGVYGTPIPEPQIPLLALIACLGFCCIRQRE